MKEIIIFTKKEYEQLKELIDDMRDDIWDIKDSCDRAIMTEDLYKLKNILGICEE